jgi:hypothetical protein
MTARRFSVLGTRMSLLAKQTVARAGTVTLSHWNAGDFAGNAAGGGGPFKATTSTPLGDFVTSCVEFNEHVCYGRQYNLTLSDATNDGGVSGQLPGLNIDPLSDATKWIYPEVRTEGYRSFAAYFGTGAYVGARVQEVVWFLEGERAVSEIGVSSWDLAQFALGRDWNALHGAGHRVYAMNMTASTRGRVQDQLAWEQVASIGAFRVEADAAQNPEPSAGVLLGAGLAGLMAWRLHSTARR